MTTCDVLIVGGGPAGSTCARTLTRAGFDVVVLDKAVFPRDKPCAGWITPAVIDALALPIDEYREGRVFQPISAFRTSRLGGREVHTRFATTVSYGIRRCEFDHFLLQRSGAHIVAGEPLVSLRRQGECWIANDKIAAPLVIGAGGHFCPVAKRVTYREGDEDHARRDGRDEPIVAAQEIEVALTPEQAASCRVSGDTPELFLCDDLEGYGWCFRKGPVLNIGLGRQDRHQLSRHVREFVDWLVAAHRVPADLAWRWKGHAYLLRGSSPRPAIADHLMLIGDALGLAYARSGEGIRPAIESGLLAAETVKAARGRSGCDNLEPYRVRLRERFGDEAIANPTYGVPKRVALAIAGRLLANRWFTRHVFLQRWFLHAEQPALAASLE